MTERTTSAAIAIVPCNDIDFAERWWSRLGFSRPADGNAGGYRMLSDGHDAAVHLQPAAEGWLIGGKNPFGIYLYTGRVDEIARAAREAIAEAGEARSTNLVWASETSVNGTGTNNLFASNKDFETRIETLVTVEGALGDRRQF